MVYETLIALRYLGSRKRNHFVSVITVISCAGVALGVWALIVVLSVMAGFENDLKSKILGTYAHLLVDREKGNVEGSQEPLLDRLEALSGVDGASAFLRSEVMISSHTNLAGVALKGIRTERAAVVNRLKDVLKEGELVYLDQPARIPPPSFPPIPAPGGSGEPEDAAPSVLAEAVAEEPEEGEAPPAARTEPADAAAALMPPLDLSRKVTRRELPGVLIGSELKKSLLVLVGDEVNLVSPLGDLGPTGLLPRSRAFRVAGVFHTGMYEYDSKMVYVTLPAAQTFLGVGDEVTGIELRVSDPDHTQGLLASVGSLVRETGLRVRDWKALNASLFAALLLEKVAMFVILTLVTIVAGFNIVASLIMVVLEKQKEVAILKALGTSNRSIQRIFMIEGLLIGVVGMLLGVTAGLATCLIIDRFGIPLDREVYYIDRLPIQLHALDISLIALSAVLISFLATLYPSWLAARLRPAEALRHE